MNPQLNKKVKKYLDSYFKDTKANSPEHQEAVMLILKGALTDANFHSEAKELGKYFPKASKKYIGTPMEGVIEGKGVDIAKMAKWDGHDIIDAFAFYLSMSIGGSFGNRLMSLKESIEESLVEEGEKLDENNVPTNPSKWSYYKAQAKKKFDVYPSAYANGWAAKQYKKAGGGWKSESVNEELRPDEVEFIANKLGNSMPNHTNYDFDKGPDAKQVLTALKKYHKDFFRHSTNKQKQEIVKLVQKITTESVDEGMVSPRRGHNYYQLTKDTPIKYVSGHSGIGLKVPGVLLHNEYDTIKGKKGAYIIDYFGQHFYVDLKNKFASRIAHPENREQNKDLMKNVKSVDVAPDHSDWKKYVRESVTESVSRTAMEIGGLTGVNKDAIQKFVDDNKLDIEKVYQFVKKGKLADRMKLVSAIAGKPNNPVQKQMVKQFGESINEATKYKVGQKTPVGKIIGTSVWGKGSKQAWFYDVQKPGHSPKQYSEESLDKIMGESVNESQLKEFKHKVGSETIQFKVSPYRTGISLIAASGNDLDKLQDVMGSEDEVKGEIRKSLEKKLRIPIEIDRDYEGAGFGFKIDLYSLAKMVK
ncbi:hypothetical protein N9W01_00155 [bacterium]|nr:hypothetical protein [bacterium]